MYSQAVDIKSLGWRTDLMVRGLAGSLVAYAPDHVVVRTAGRSDVYWGNFILIPADGAGRDAAGWLQVFAGEFPRARHVAIGIDQKTVPATPSADLEALGLTAELNSVLTATSLNESNAVADGIEIRPLLGDSDWEQVLALRLAVARAEGRESAEHAGFLKDAVSEAAAVAARQVESYFGAFRGGMLLCSLGVLVGTGGVARFQDVETHPEHRRQGLAGRLVSQAGGNAVRRRGAVLLVIVADPMGPAIGLYRKLGFKEVETQVQMLMVPSPA